MPVSLRVMAFFSALFCKRCLDDRDSTWRGLCSSAPDCQCKPCPFLRWLLTGPWLGPLCAADPEGSRGAGCTHMASGGSPRCLWQECPSAGRAGGHPRQGDTPPMGSEDGGKSSAPRLPSSAVGQKPPRARPGHSATSVPASVTGASDTYLSGSALGADHTHRFCSHFPKAAAMDVLHCERP